MNPLRGQIGKPGIYSAVSACWDFSQRNGNHFIDVGPRGMHAEFQSSTYGNGFGAPPCPGSGMGQSYDASGNSAGALVRGRPTSYPLGMSFGCIVFTTSRSGGYTFQSSNSWANLAFQPRRSSSIDRVSLVKAGVVEMQASTLQWENSTLDWYFIAGSTPNGSGDAYVVRKKLSGLATAFDTEVATETVNHSGTASNSNGTWVVGGNGLGNAWTGLIQALWVCESQVGMNTLKAWAKDPFAILPRRNDRILLYHQPPSGGAISISVNSCFHAHLADSPAISQTHEVSVNDADHAHTVDQPAISQTHVVQVQEATHAHTADQPSVSAGIQITPNDADHSHAADQPVISQTHEITVNEAVHAHTADQPSLSQVHQVSVNGALHSHTTDQPTITQTHVVTVNPALHTHTADQPAITQTHIITVNPTLHAHTSDNITVTSGIQIVPNESTHAHTTDSPVLSQTHEVSVDSAVHSHAADSTTLTTGATVSVDSTLHAHTADNTTLDLGVAIVVQGAVHSHTATTPVLTQTHVVQVDNTLHSHTADNISVTLGSLLPPFEVTVVEVSVVGVKPIDVSGEVTTADVSNTLGVTEL